MQIDYDNQPSKLIQGELNHLLEIARDDPEIDHIQRIVITRLDRTKFNPKKQPQARRKARRAAAQSHAQEG